MKTRFLLLLFLLGMIPACSSNDRWKLHGRWQSTETNPATVIQFDSSGTVTITLSNGTSISGRYTLLAGDYVDFELNSIWNGAQKHREKVILNGSALVLRDSDGTTIRFQRDYKY